MDRYTLDELLSHRSDFGFLRDRRDPHHEAEFVRVDDVFRRLEEIYDGASRADPDDDRLSLSLCLGQLEKLKDSLA